MSTKILCDIYKSNKREELYLYVAKKDGLGRVPEALLAKIDQEKVLMSLILSPSRSLARADVNKVLAEIEKSGYYLQLPPSPYEKQQPET